jgi:type III pantothenate kinase
VTPDIVVDIGNSRMKWGRCDGVGVAEMVSLPHDAPVEWKRQAEAWGATGQTRWAVAGVVPKEVQRLRDWLAARGGSPAVVTNDLFADGGPTGFITKVDELHRIGIDRLVTAFAAHHRRRHKLAPVVVINVGTAMTVDFVQGVGGHVGGVVLPGPHLMAKSLHAYTAKLPQVDIDPKLPTTFVGRNTEQAIGVGIAHAVLCVAYQLVWDWAKHTGRPPWVYATGGDVGYLRGFRFTADVAGFEIDPALTLDGIRLAAEFV